MPVEAVLVSRARRLQRLSHGSRPEPMMWFAYFRSNRGWTEILEATYRELIEQVRRVEDPSSAPHLSNRDPADQ